MTVKTIELNKKEVENLISYADNNEIYFNFFEGTLLDNYTFYDTKEIEKDGYSSNYMIIKEVPLNEWTSKQVLIMTNSIEDIEKFEAEKEL